MFKTRLCATVGKFDTKLLSAECALHDFNSLINPQQAMLHAGCRSNKLERRANFEGARVS